MFFFVLLAQVLLKYMVLSEIKYSERVLITTAKMTLIVKRADKYNLDVVQLYGFIRISRKTPVVVEVT